MRGVAVAPVVGAWTPRAHGAREGRVRGFLGGALRCLAGSEAPPQTKKKKKLKKLPNFSVGADTSDDSKMASAQCFEPVLWMSVEILIVLAMVNSLAIKKNIC